MKRTTSSGRIRRAKRVQRLSPMRSWRLVGLARAPKGGSLRGSVMRFTKPLFMRNVFAQSALLIDCRKGTTVKEAMISDAPLVASERVGKLLCDLVGPKLEVFIEADSV